MPIENPKSVSECFLPDHADTLRTEYVQAMTKYATDNFAQIDTDGNGFLTAKELAAAASKAPVNSNERDYLTALERKVGDVEDLSNDEWGPEWKGIHRNDLSQLSKLAAAMPSDMAEARAIASVGEAKWWQLVGDEDKIHRQDFDQDFARVHNATQCDWAALRAMRANYDSIRHLHPKIGSIKLDDLRIYPAEVKSKYQLVFDLTEKYI